MRSQVQGDSAHASDAALIRTIGQLARDASIEISVHDVRHLAASRAMLAPGKKIYVNYLPKQTWTETEAACIAVRAAGFDPVPHVPVRLIPDAAALEGLLSTLVGRAAVSEVLLIAGDYPQAEGPYSTVSEILSSGLLQGSGLKRVSVAGHPEGHPRVALDKIRQAERDKAILATQLGLEVILLSQFVFECNPFLDWLRELRAHEVRARVVAGLAGPAGLATLLKFAVRCGAGASIRALRARPASMMKLIGEHGPEAVVRGLAQAHNAGEADFAGVHLFCFGGYLRTCRWLHAVAAGHIQLRDDGGFKCMIDGMT